MNQETDLAEMVKNMLGMNQLDQEVRQRLGFGYKEGYYSEDYCIQVMSLNDEDKREWIAREDVRADAQYQQQKEGDD